jgi:hypothetical protein
MVLHLATSSPNNNPDPEVLQINIIEMGEEGGEYAKTYLPFNVNPAEYCEEKKITCHTENAVRRGVERRTV